MDSYPNMNNSTDTERLDWLQVGGDGRNVERVYFADGLFWVAEAGDTKEQSGLTLRDAIDAAMLQEIRRPDSMHLEHGFTCPKVQHDGLGHQHGPEDDAPYDVDGVSYCGRCHQAL